jgi:HK97 family phage prohead protease
MNNGLFYRSLELDRSTLNKEARSVDVSFSSELAVKRWFGSEILLHGEGNVNLSRLRSMGSALLNHDPNKIVGRVANVKIEEKRGKATIIFDDDEDGNKAMRKVESGSLRGISVGYMIEKYREVRSEEEWEGIKGPAYVATRWAPYEITLTAVPADHTVGIGRDATRSLDGIEIERSEKEQKDMTPDEVRQIIKEEREASAKAIAEMVRAQLAEDNKPKIRVTPDEFGELLSRATAISPSAAVEFAKMVAEGNDARSIEKKLFDMVTGRGDARNSGGTPELPSQPGTQAGNASIKDIEDDVLVRSLTSPSVVM